MVGVDALLYYRFEASAVKILRVFAYGVGRISQPYIFMRSIMQEMLQYICPNLGFMLCCLNLWRGYDILLT